MSAFFEKILESSFSQEGLTHTGAPVKTTDTLSDSGPGATLPTIRDQTMRVIMAGATHVGRRRANNQDYFVCQPDLGLGVVADGIGGMNGGEIASQMAAEEILTALKIHLDATKPVTAAPWLLTAVHTANQMILTHGTQHSQLTGMGTTLEALWFDHNLLHLLHIGDSRTYLWAHDHLWPLTLDHNVETYVERNWLDPAALIPKQNATALMQALGLASCQPDLYTYACRVGDTFITASDGLFDMVSDEQIFACLNQYKTSPLPVLVEQCIQKANEGGGKDNITVLISQVVSL